MTAPPAPTLESLMRRLEAFAKEYEHRDASFRAPPHKTSTYITVSEIIALRSLHYTDASKPCPVCHRWDAEDCEQSPQPECTEHGGYRYLCTPACTQQSPQPQSDERGQQAATETATQAGASPAASDPSRAASEGIVAGIWEAIGRYSIEICRRDAELAPPQYLLEAVQRARHEIVRLTDERDAYMQALDTFESNQS